MNYERLHRILLGSIAVRTELIGVAPPFRRLRPLIRDEVGLARRALVVKILIWQRRLDVRVPQPVRSAAIVDARITARPLGSAAGAACRRVRGQVRVPRRFPSEGGLAPGPFPRVRASYKRCVLKTLGLNAGHAVATGAGRVKRGPLLSFQS